ncbi:MAG: hypothetical protein RQ866_08870 [Bacteroidales bacterium]|nr:hypothetical protein [Bacteroidales bacterium]
MDKVMQENNTNVQQLFEAGLSQMKKIQNTADVLDHQTTEKGRACLKELKRMQLIRVAKNKLEKLRAML